MAKQKKGKTLSNLDKSIGRVIGIDTQNPVEYRKMMSDFLKRYESYADALGLTGNPSAKPNVKREALDFYRSICREDSITDYICTVRALVVGYWYSHRVIYSFSQEAIDYLEKEMDIDNFCLSITSLQKVATEEPIFIELPPGYPIQRAFLGRVSFFSDEAVKNINLKDQDFCMYTCLVEKDESLALIGLSDDMSVSKYLQTKTESLDGHFEEVRFLTKLVVYIGYMKNMKDMKDTVFEEETIKNGIRYKVKPAYAESPTADETNRRGWIRAGLAPIMGYYDRSNMIRDFNKDLAALPQEANHYDIDDTDESMRVFLKKVVLSWEGSRNLYGFDNELAISVALETASDVIFSGISSELLDYMPYNAMALYPTEASTFMAALISRCTLKEGGQGIFLIVFGRHDEQNSVYCFEENRPFVQGDMEKWNEQIDVNASLVLCVFKYVLTILQRKTLRKMGDTSQNAAFVRHPPQEKLPVPPIPIVRQGGDISDIVPLAMYNITKRAVKRLPRKEETRRSGWKMTPHTRRRHPHRYWVGRGENRHLEVRWLENININKKDKKAVPAVTVHEVK